MSVQDNIDWCRKAVEAVRSNKIRANNKADAKDMSTAEHAELTQCISDSRAAATGGLMHTAQIAMQRHCGNCEEQTAVVIAFLTANQKQPVDLMTLYSSTERENPNDQLARFIHVFVVLGRVSGSKPALPWTWGAEAVICDPWHDRGKVYPVKDFESMMFRGYHFVPDKDAPGGRKTIGFTGPLSPELLYRIPS